MEVHPPEHGIHSWRDFFVHMGTIVLGLLIALALEQSVEGLHRHHERTDLREALRGESEQVLSDATHAESTLRERLHAAARQRDALYNALWSQQHADISVQTTTPEDLEYPFDPIFRSALATSRVSLLTPEETNAYMELMYDMEQAKSSYNEYANAVHDRMRFETELPRAGTSAIVDVSRLDRPMLQRYLDLLAVEIENGQRLRLDCAQTSHAEETLLRGELRLSKLYEAEAEGMHSVSPVESPAGQIR